MALPSQSLKRKLDSAGLDVKDDERRDRCYKCGGHGHVQKECTSSLVYEPKATTGELHCYKCQGKGHFARACPNLSRDMCYFCGTMGHHGLDCPLITRMFGNLPSVKRKELMAKMHANPQFASQVMREMTFPDYSGFSANPLQALMSLLQSNLQAGTLNAATAAQLGLGAAGQPALYANPYNQQTTAQTSSQSALSSYYDVTNTQPYASTETSTSTSAVGGSSGSADSSSPGAATVYPAYDTAAPSGSPTSTRDASVAASGNSGTYSAPPTMYTAAQQQAQAAQAQAAQAAVQANTFTTDVLATLRALSGGAFGGSGFGFGGFPGGFHTGTMGCFKCGQAGHFARECPNAPIDAGPVCYRCGQTGHMAKDCVNPPLPGSQASSNESCFRCGERGHFSRDCVKNGAVPSKDACFKCGQPGHRTRECTGPDIRVCFVCRQSGHVSSACPERLAR